MSESQNPQGSGQKEKTVRVKPNPELATDAVTISGKSYAAGQRIPKSEFEKLSKTKSNSGVQMLVEDK